MRPPETGARVGQVHQQREQVRVPLLVAAAIVPLDRDRVDIERHRVYAARAQAAADLAGVRPEVEGEAGVQ